MKFSPTTTLALALAAGLAGAAGAQTTTTPGAATTDGRQTTSPSGQSAWQPGQPAAGTTQPQTSYGQAQPGMQGQSGMQGQPGMQGQATTGPGQSTQTRSPPSQGTAQTSSPMQVRQAQERLQALGLYKGPVDGMMDPDTRAAIANFQQRNGIQRTAELDQPTLDRLMAGQSAGSGSGTPPSAQPPAGAPSAGSAPTGAGDGAPGRTINR